MTTNLYEDKSKRCFGFLLNKGKLKIEHVFTVLNLEH